MNRFNKLIRESMIRSPRQKLCDRVSEKQMGTENSEKTIPECRISSLFDANTCKSLGTSMFSGAMMVLVKKIRAVTPSGVLESSEFFIDVKRLLHLPPEKYSGHRRILLVDFAASRKLALGSCYLTKNFELSRNISIS